MAKRIKTRFTFWAESDQTFPAHITPTGERHGALLEYEVSLEPDSETLHNQGVIYTLNPQPID